MLTKSDVAGKSSASPSNGSTSEAPPPYQRAPPTTSGAGSLPPPTNYVSVSKGDGSIRGTWTIDSRLRVPEALLVPVGAGAERHNLSLRTKDGALSANIALLSPGPERASILLDTKDGSIKLVLMSRQNDQPFKAQLKTSDGSITIEIPRSFKGPIRHSKRYQFSNEIQQNLQNFSRESSFVGSLEGSSFSNFETWQGDQIDATTSDGRIKVKYYGEVEEHSRKEHSRKGFFSWL